MFLNCRIDTKTRMFSVYKIKDRYTNFLIFVQEATVMVFLFCP